MSHSELASLMIKDDNLDRAEGSIITEVKPQRRMKNWTCNGFYVISAHNVKEMKSINKPSSLSKKPNSSAKLKQSWMFIWHKLLYSTGGLPVSNQCFWTLRNRYHKIPSIYPCEITKLLIYKTQSMPLLFWNKLKNISPRWQFSAAKFFITSNLDTKKKLWNLGKVT